MAVENGDLAEVKRLTTGESLGAKLVSEAKERAERARKATKILRTHFVLHDCV